MAHDVLSCGVQLASPPMTPVSPAEDKATSKTTGDEGGSTEGVAPSMETENLPVKVRYTVDCEYEDGPDFRVSKNDKPLDIQAKKDENPTVPVIEVITNISVADIKKSQGNKKSDVTAAAQEGAPPTLDNKRVKWVGEESLHIHSPILSELLRNVVQYYPGQNLTGDTIIINEPYAVLAHHDTQLQALLAEHEKADGSTEFEHLRILMDFVEQRVRPKYMAAAKRLKQKNPTVTYDDVWYLQRPGQLAYAKFDGVWIGCQIASVYHRKPDFDEDLPRRWGVSVWFLLYTWRGTEIRTAEHEFTVEQFDGERAITGLSVYPREYFDNGDEGERRAQFEKRGGDMGDILWKGHRYLHHDGLRADKSQSMVNEPIVLGRAFNEDFEFPESEWADLYFKDVEKPFPPDPPAASTTETVAMPSVLRLDTTKHNISYLTKDIRFMMSPVHAAFVLESKTWILVNIDNTSPLTAPKLPPGAIVDPEKQRVIDALSDHHAQDGKAWSADYIKNKGDGVVILLHGPPGVGKTYTVETTAMRTKRPLISLAIAEIGTEEEGMESELTKWFSLAEQWNAILLIDECDIFLERRNYTDIKRNGVVAAFLRKVEYFGGLLFLTTNRIGEIDDAFMSRVHAVVGFEPLDVNSRKLIWGNLLTKLSEERDSIAITPGVVDYLESEEVLQLNWNGREIRNAFQTAVILAEHQAKNNKFHKPGQPAQLEAGQFQTVVKMNQNFRNYLNSINLEDEGARAHRHSIRNDSFRENQAQTHLRTPGR